MSTAKLEYIWLDGYVPTQNMRSKTKILKDFDGKIESCPVWAFDGSSTLPSISIKFILGGIESIVLKS